MNFPTNFNSPGFVLSWHPEAFLLVSAFLTKELHSRIAESMLLWDERALSFLFCHLDDLMLLSDVF